MLILMRGPSCSGKSWIVEKMCEVRPFTICSTDSYFMVDGVYQFDATQLPYYHELNFRKCTSALAAGEDVIVDNTNLTYKQMKRYIDAARLLGHEYHFLNGFEPVRRDNPKEVPSEVIDRHHEQYVPDWQIILSLLEDFDGRV